MFDMTINFSSSDTSSIKLVEGTSEFLYNASSTYESIPTPTYSSDIYSFEPIYYRDITLFNIPMFSQNKDNIQFNFFGLIKDQEKKENKKENNTKGGFIQKKVNEPEIDFDDDVLPDGFRCYRELLIYIKY